MLNNATETVSLKNYTLIIDQLLFFILELGLRLFSLNIFENCFFHAMNSHQLSKTPIQILIEASKSK